MTKILLAEDDETMVSLLKTLLVMEGYEVASLDITERDVLSAVRREEPNLILLDVNLPFINGIDFMKTLRKDEELKKTYVIMSSGMNLKQECLDSGANDFLLKPYMPDDLIAAIQQCI